MYAFIKGTIVSKNIEHIIVENNGIGYKIGMSASSINSIGNISDEVVVYTHLHVREDDMSLFGFETLEQLNMFEMLLTVSGVGPKVALAIISSISPSKFSIAVISNDAKLLSTAQGVGNKVAQRIILELKDKIEKADNFKLSGDDESVVITNNDDVSRRKFTEAINALVVLGYSYDDARYMVSNVYDDSLDLEAVIMNALKGTGK